MIAFDDNKTQDNLERYLIALGFQSARISKRWDKEMAYQEAVRYWVSRRALLLDRMHEARRLENTDAMYDTRKDIVEFNKIVPDRALRIKGSTLSKSRKLRRDASRQFEGDFGRRDYRQLGREVEQLYSY